MLYFRLIVVRISVSKKEQPVYMFLVCKMTTIFQSRGVSCQNWVKFGPHSLWMTPKKNTRKQFVADLACFCLFSGKHLNWAWMKPIFVRNTIITAVTCGFWDWFLYFSPLKDKLHKYKVSKKKKLKCFLCK